jgi:hypothetical protein
MIFNSKDPDGGGRSFLTLSKSSILNLNSLCVTPDTGTPALRHNNNNNNNNNNTDDPAILSVGLHQDLGRE